MSAVVKVDVLPTCDFCTSDAAYDARTTFGVWANMCDEHWRAFRRHTDLGTGKGQRLELRS